MIPRYKVGELVKLNNGQQVRIQAFHKRTNEYSVSNSENESFVVASYRIVGFGDEE